MKDTRASDHFVSEAEVEGLIELLDKTSFYAAGFDRGHGRLVLWEQPDPVRYWFAAPEFDEETFAWARRVMKSIHRMIGRDASIRILRTPALTEADIAIFCFSKDMLFSNEVLPRYFKKIGFSEDDITVIKKEIENVYKIPGFEWRWVDFNEDSSQKKTFSKFVQILHPDKERCKKAFSSTFAASLGYGAAFSPIESRWKSVHTTSSNFEVGDRVILHFLYNSDVGSGMTREAVVKILRRWISSEYFKNYSNSGKI